jgi:hypothetical protein
MDDAILRSDLALLEVLYEQIGFVEERIAAIAVDDPQARAGRFNNSVLMA